VILITDDGQKYRGTFLNGGFQNIGGILKL